MSIRRHGSSDNRDRDSRNPSKTSRYRQRIVEKQTRGVRRRFARERWKRCRRSQKNIRNGQCCAHLPPQPVLDLWQTGTGGRAQGGRGAVSRLRCVCVYVCVCYFFFFRLCQRSWVMGTRKHQSSIRACSRCRQCTLRYIVVSHF